MASQWAHNNIELFNDWIVENTIAANPIIATSDPVVYASDHLTMSIAGPDYAGWMLKHGFPIFPLLSGLVNSSQDLYPSLDAIAAQVWECDTRFTDGNGNVWVCDSQLNLEEGGILQVANPTGNGWIDTDFKPGIPPPGAWGTLTTQFAYTSAGSSIVSASAWGQNWTAPSGVPVVPLLPLGWTGAAQLVKQLQLGENATGAAFSLSFRNVNVSCVGAVSA